MQTPRNKLLITLILVTLALPAFSSVSSGLMEADRMIEAITSTDQDPSTQVDSGEPEGPGQAPPPVKTNGAGLNRQEIRATSPSVGSWLTLIGRIWAARLWGVTF